MDVAYLRHATRELPATSLPPFVPAPDLITCFHRTRSNVNFEPFRLALRPPHPPRTGRDAYERLTIALQRSDKANVIPLEPYDNRKHRMKIALCSSNFLF